MKKKLAFTFIEIMIAIVIFSIGILAVLRLVTANLGTMDENNTRIQATFLAKEWIELVYNLRDTNLEREFLWNCVPKNDFYDWDMDDLQRQLRSNDDINDALCDGFFGTWKNLKISFDPNLYLYTQLSDKYLDFPKNYKQNKLYLFTGGINTSWYAYTGVNWKDSYFARYISFDLVREWEDVLPHDKILKVRSHVLYMKWSNTWEVVFESFIWNY